MGKIKHISKNDVKNILPQNIVSIGDSTLQDKKIYFLQKTYKEIYRFTKGKTSGESGGILIGSVIEEFNKVNVLVTGFIEAKFCESGSATLTFTHKTWEYVHKEIDKRYKGKKIVGWIHTHPDFGIFLSEYDEFIHKNFFTEKYHIAYVIDNIRGEEGVYTLKNDKLEKLPGFYIYDRPGTQLKLKGIEKIHSEVRKRNGFKIFTIIELFLILILFWMVMSLKFELLLIQNDISSIVEQTNKGLSEMYKLIEDKGEI